MSQRSQVMLLVHGVWATSRRIPLLVPSLDDALLAMVANRARRIGCRIEAAGCADDHIHAILNLSPSVPLDERWESESPQD